MAEETATGASLQITLNELEVQRKKLSYINTDA